MEDILLKTHLEQVKEDTHAVMFEAVATAYDMLLDAGLTELEAMAEIIGEFEPLLNDFKAEKADHDAKVMIYRNLLKR